MHTWTLRLGLSLMITAGFWPSRLPAQADPPPPYLPNTPYGPATYLPYAPQVLVVPAVPYEPARPPQFPAAYALPKSPPPAEYALRRALNNHGLGCYANRDGNCGSFYSEMRFIFGSCRSFFGDTCDPHQPCAARRQGLANGPNGCVVPGDFAR